MSEHQNKTKINFVVDPKLLEDFDTLVGEHGYDRSEALREGMRLLMDKLRERRAKPEN